MAMTKTDATDVQTLVRWITGAAHEGADQDLGDRARDALIRLADRSHEALMAGLMGGYVRHAGWPAPGLPLGAREPASEVER